MKLPLKRENRRKHKDGRTDGGSTRCAKARDEKGKARGEKRKRRSTYKSLACGQPFVTSVGRREGRKQTSSTQSGNLLVMVLLVRLRGRNDCLLVLPAFGHSSFTDRRKLATFPLVFLVLPDPLERVSAYELVRFCRSFPRTFSFARLEWGLPLQLGFCSN